MIRLFGTTDTVFTTNGDVVINPIYAHVHRADNGSFYLDLEVGLEYADILTAGKIVVAPTKDGDQAFRVYKPVKSGSVISAICRHVFYDTENRVIVDTNVVNKTCNDALVQLNNAAVPSSPFSVISDIVTTKNYRCVRKSLYEAIQTVLERWGGHLVRNNFAIEVRANIGSDKGVNISYGKNLEQIRSTEDWSDVVTQLLPVGKDGTLLNAVDPSASIYVTSTTQYDIPYTKTVSFSQDIDPDDYPTEDAYKAALVADLQAQAQAYVNEHCIPYVNYELEAVNVDATIGDTIKVDDERLGIELLTNVIEYEYDCITEQIVTLQFGNFRKTLTDLMTTVRDTASGVADEKVSASQTILEKELKDATDAIMSVLEDGHVVINGSNIMVVDNLPVENAQDVLLIDRGGIGFSRTGIHGTFTTAWQINGTFLANVIKAGILSDALNKNSWNLETGEFITQKGQIGGFEIGTTDLTVGDIDDPTVAGCKISPTEIVFNDGSAWRLAMGYGYKIQQYINNTWSDGIMFQMIEKSGTREPAAYIEVKGDVKAVFADWDFAGAGYPNFIKGGLKMLGKLFVNEDLTVNGNSITFGVTTIDEDQFKGMSGNLMTTLLQGTGTGYIDYTAGKYNAYLLFGRPSSAASANVTMLVPDIFMSQNLAWQITDESNFYKFEINGGTFTGIFGTGEITAVYGMY